MAFPGDANVKGIHLPMQEIQEKVGSIPGWGRSLGGGNGNPFQYSFLANSWGLQSMGLQSGTWLSTHTHRHNS